MHLLASHIRSEFLASPQLIRFDYAEGQDGFEPTLLIKCSTLLLKYISQGVRMQLGFASVGGRLMYMLKVYDDGEKGAILWSILENENEKVAVSLLPKIELCQAFLFNELAVNVAWAELRINADPALVDIVTKVNTGGADYAALKADATPIFDHFHENGPTTEGLIVLELVNTVSWKPVFSHFLTSHGTSSPIRLFDKDEGGQQEEMVVWLTDNLHPRGVHHSPQIPKGAGFRELTDILLSYEYGAFLIESKVLSIFARDTLPDRTKLRQNITGHVIKAVAQLRGGMRRLKDGTPVTSKTGVPLDIERSKPMHGIILIPDLDLIEDRESFGRDLIAEFKETTGGGFLHLLDISELLRIVQAAEMISARSTTTTLMMAFDYYLMERAKYAVQAGTLCIEVLLRFAKE